MTIKARCHQCGKRSEFSASDAGLTALCIACGARFTIPTETAETLPASAAGDDLIDSAILQDVPASQIATPLPRPTPFSMPSVLLPAPPAVPEPAAAPPIPVGGAGETTMLGSAIVPPAFPSPQPAALRPPTDTTSRPLLYACLGSAITILVVLAGVLVLSVKPTFEDENRAALRDLKGKADAHFLVGEYRQAYDAYRKMDQIVVGHPIDDPQLKADLAKARDSRDQVFAQLLKKEQEEAATRALAATSSTRPAAPPRELAMTTVPIPPAPAVPIPPPATQPATDPTAVAAVREQSWPQYNPKPLGSPPPATRRTPTTLAHVTPLDPAPAKAATQPLPPADAPVTADPPAPRRPAITVRANRDADSADRRNLRYPGELVTDEEIGRAIQNGVNFLLAEFRAGRLQAGAGRNDAYYGGLNALCVYALLQSAQAIKDERLNLKGPLVRQMLNAMKEAPMEGGPETYARGIRATALAVLNRPEDRGTLQQDVSYLLASHTNGAYTYSDDHLRRGGSRRVDSGNWDNSNSQYGLLGVWSAAEIGAEINTPYWQAVDRHWTECQNADGSWDYTVGRGSGRMSMTVAGIASLFVTHDYLEAPRFGTAVGREPFSPALRRGLDYLEHGDASINLTGGYALYGLERVGLASGFKFFGDHDWYRELAAAIVRGQNVDGSWGGEVETAYHLLFLARGRHPILMNKLRFEGAWANRPRDVANLARFGSRELERALNWQVVPLARDYTDWLDSPVLYIASHTPLPRLGDTDIEKIRNYALSGGLIFTQADGGSAAFNQWVDAFASRLFPDYELQDLPFEHDVYTMLYKPTQRPRLRGVSNGSRLLMVHSPTDVSQHWQLRKDKTQRPMFETGINLFLYAAGKGDLRNRLASPYIPPLGPPSGGTIKVARVRYPGNWDPEPLAWTRFARYVQRETDVAVDVTKVELAQLNPTTTPFAHWTGTASYTPTAAEIESLRKYVEGGGVLLVDSCGGAADFVESSRAALAKAFPEHELKLLPRTHPILTGGQPGTEDLANPIVRPLVKSKYGGTSGRLDTLRAGTGRVIHSPLDLTTGLLGANTWGVYGFDPDYACKLLQNTLIWSATGMKEE